jgi:hypothetical protein
MAELLTDPAALRAWVGRLAVGRAAGLTDQEQEALAEACFRLALHPDTHPGERLRLLRQAHECDPGHPKYAYHLACGYLRHGRLDEAVEWLEQVQRVCPQSQRVWVHTSLLQRELHRRHREDERYEPAALLRRAAALMAAVEQGAEQVDAELLDLHPPTIVAAASGAGRTPMAPPGNPQGCHWTGVHDLLAEELLEARASPATRDRLLPRLERVALEGARRDGGAAAFAILGVAWVLGGYPVAAVRRLRRRLPPDAAGGSLDLLDLVCELYEAEPGEVAARPWRPRSASSASHRCWPRWYTSGACSSGGACASRGSEDPTRRRAPSWRSPRRRGAPRPSGRPTRRPSWPSNSSARLRRWRSSRRCRSPTRRR